MVSLGLAGGTEIGNSQQLWK